MRRKAERNDLLFIAVFEELRGKMRAVIIEKKKPVAAIRRPGLRLFIKSLDPLKSDLIRSVAVDLGANYIVLGQAGHRIPILHVLPSG
jgi:hypothetical protein